ncbi:ERAP1-like C-terminal domain-containing protein [Tessaracoccus aquimaris]|uniref:ERAP1-like C-terminal domain-containing protein n=1 Tax=Tessaracoccus aquimaris TaxID=1332264 RepID=UPI00202ABD5B|nr:ERAP1-like C-terminal domain-containing protein [Tessaracoccus aquimaris]
MVHDGRVLLRGRAGRHPLAAFWRDGARAALLGAEPGSAEQLLWAKAYLRAASLAPEDVRWLLADGAVPGLEASVDLTWLAWESLATQGSVTDAELDAVLATDDTAAGRVSRLRCWASQPDPLVKAEAWRRAHVVGGETNEQVDALMAGYNALGQGRLRAPFVGPYFEMLLPVWQEHPIEIAMRLVRAGFPDRGHVDAADWLAANPTAPRTLRRLVIEGAYEAEVAADARKAAKPRPGLPNLGD